MNNYRANQHRLGRNERGKVIVRFGGTGRPVRSNVPQRDARDILTELCLANGETICPKIGARQWTCVREECVCHRKEYAHTFICNYVVFGGQCDCGAKT